MNKSFVKDQLDKIVIWTLTITFFGHFLFRASMKFFEEGHFFAGFGMFSSLIIFLFVCHYYFIETRKQKILKLLELKS